MSDNQSADADRAMMDASEEYVQGRFPQMILQAVGAQSTGFYDAAQMRAAFRSGYDYARRSPSPTMTGEAVDPHAMKRTLGKLACLDDKDPLWSDKAETIIWQFVASSPPPVAVTESMVDGWQPIETAPKDGTVILGALQEGHSQPLAVLAALLTVVGSKP